QMAITEGGSISFGPDHIHRLTGEAEQSISLHAYSPPLWRLGQYTIDDGGVLRRVSVCYADELRPLASPPPGQAAQPPPPRAGAPGGRRAGAGARCPRGPAAGAAAAVTGRCGRRKGGPRSAGSAGTPRTAAPPRG